MSCFNCVEQKTITLNRERKFDIEILNFDNVENIQNYFLKPDSREIVYLRFMKVNIEWFLLCNLGGDKKIINLCDANSNEIHKGLSSIIGLLDVKKPEYTKIKSKIAGILRIKQSYQEETTKPVDNFSDAVVFAYNSIMDVKIEKREAKELTAIAWNVQENSGMDKFNDFASSLLKYCLENFNKKIENIEIYFNLSEDGLKEIALKCRYAIKLDHKGMAENASSIVSCLDLYLPTFTTQGYATSSDFLEDGEYGKTLIFPNQIYVFYQENDIIEIRPKLPTIEWVCNMLENETDEIYMERLKILHKLYESGLFKCERLVKNLMDSLSPGNMSYKNEF